MCHHVHYEGISGNRNKPICIGLIYVARLIPYSMSSLRVYTYVHMLMLILEQKGFGYIRPWLVHSATLKLCRLLGEDFVSSTQVKSLYRIMLAILKSISYTKHHNKYTIYYIAKMFGGENL